MRSRLALASVLFAALLGISRAALAADPPDRAACASSFEKGQRLRRQGSYLDARSEFLVCGRPPCPEALRPGCARWLSEIEHLIPSIVVSVRGGDGNDLKDAKVYVDDKLVSEHLDGRAIDLDPGDHKVRVEAAGQVLAQDVLAPEADKGRVVVFRLETPKTEPPSPTFDAPPLVPTRPVEWPTYVFGAVGIVGAGVFTGFALHGESQYADLGQCRPGCNPSDVDAAKRSYLIGDVALGVSIVALGIALGTYLLRPTVLAPARVGATR